MRMFEYSILWSYGNDSIIERQNFDGDVEAVDWVMQHVMHTSCGAVVLECKEKDGARMVLHLIA